MKQTKNEVIGEINEIFADAVAGKDLENIEHRLSIATTKLDAVTEGSRIGQRLNSLVITALDAFREIIGKNPEKAHYYAKAFQCLFNDDIKGAQDALDEFSVNDFLKNLS